MNKLKIENKENNIKRKKIQRIKNMEQAKTLATVHTQVLLKTTTIKYLK